MLLSTLTMPIITLTDNHTLTIPAELLAQLGLKPGDRLRLEPDGAGELRLTPLREPAPTAPPAPSFREAANRKNLTTSIQFIKGVGPKLAETLARKGITTM